MNAELAIRACRAAFNRALAARDLAAIAPLLAVDAVLVAGTDSALIVGRKAQLLAWKHEFAGAALYVRRPETIIVSPILPLAFEHGAWTGTERDGGAAIASGTYTAKWRLVGTDWLIEAELFLTTG